jgi:hypothetical protein
MWVGLDWGTRRVHRESQANPRGALKNKSTWTDEDDIYQVKRDEGLTEIGHTSTSRRSRGTQVDMGGLSGLGLKATSRQVFRFGPQNRGCVWCGQIADMEGTWRHHEDEAKSLDCVSVQCFYKSWIVLSYVASGGVFLSFANSLI